MEVSQQQLEEHANQVKELGQSLAFPTLRKAPQLEKLIARLILLDRRRAQLPL